jgi:hypothetical protein
MVYRPPFPYSAADYRAREAGLAVLACHHAAHPPGVPLRDHWGNPVKTERVWIGSSALGRDAVGRIDCAYADVTQSIHTIATPDLGTALAQIRRALLIIEEFPQRADYVAAMLPYAGGADPVTIADSWTVALDCALRARQRLPADLVSWLVLLDCARW